MNKFSVNVGISNRHVHLTVESFRELFGNIENEEEFSLSQKGEYASKLFVDLKGSKGIIKHVRVMGPNRSYNQVEISNSDAFLLGVKPPVRRSGDLDDAEDIIVCNGSREVYLKKACILAQSHVHMNREDAKKYGVEDKQEVLVSLGKERKGNIYAHIKVSDNGVLDFHIDRDEANAFLVNNGDEVEVII